MSANKDAQKKLDGHRLAIQQHITKYRIYPHQQDKEFALKTIRNVQKEIADIRKKFPTTLPDLWDTWKP